MLNRIRILSYKYPFLRKLIYPTIIMRRYLHNRKYRNVEVLLENLSGILAEDPVIYLDEFQGLFEIGAHSDLLKQIVPNKQYEPMITQCC